MRVAAACARNSVQLQLEAKRPVPGDHSNETRKTAKQQSKNSKQKTNPNQKQHTKPQTRKIIT